MARGPDWLLHRGRVLLPRLRPCVGLAGGVVMTEQEREWRAFARLAVVALSLALLVAVGILWVQR